MFKKIVILLILLILGGVLYVAYMMETKPLAGYDTKTIRMGDTELVVFVADTQEKRTQGLMNISELEANMGMIFIFPDSSARTFWNKNTLLPLDIIWVSNGNVVGTSSLPSILQSGNRITSVPSPEVVDTVVEVNAGWAQSHDIQAWMPMEIK